MLHRKVVRAKEKYFSIYIPASDAPVLREHLVYLPPSIIYKMPRLKKKRSLLSFFKTFLSASFPTHLFDESVGKGKRAVFCHHLKMEIFFFFYFFSFGSGIFQRTSFCCTLRHEVLRPALRTHFSPPALQAEHFLLRWKRAMVDSSTIKEEYFFSLVFKLCLNFFEKEDDIV
jgi:hypothetical protein